MIYINFSGVSMIFFTWQKDYNLSNQKMSKIGVKFRISKSIIWEST
jgi:hypothetical protein